MKIKKVNRYECDFCSKRNYSAGHMRAHELHCTMNPKRKCRMCDKMELNQLDISELLVILPSPVVKDYPGCEEPVTNIEEINKGIDSLHDKVEGCPACILAVIRQKGIPVPATKFDFKKELNSFWSDYNDDLAERYGYHF